MVESIGALSSPGRGVPARTSAAGLQVELARAEAELSECVNCATADTAQGRAKIQQVEAKVQALKARLENLQQAPRIEPDPPAKIAPEPSSLGSQIDLSA